MSEENNENGHSVQIQLPDWKDFLKKSIKEIKDLKPNDRLDVSYGLYFLFFALSKSCGGWLQWLQNPSVIKEFSEDQLREYYDSAKKSIMELLELDYKATDKYFEAIKKVEKRIGIINSQGQGQRYTA